MKKLAAFTAITLTGVALLAVPVLAHGTGGMGSGNHMGNSQTEGMMGRGAMHSQDYLDMTPADRDSMHNEMGAVMKKWMPNFAFNDGEDCGYKKGKTDK